MDEDELENVTECFEFGLNQFDGELAKRTTAAFSKFLRLAFHGKDAALVEEKILNASIALTDALLLAGGDGERYAEYINGSVHLCGEREDWWQ